MSLWIKDVASRHLESLSRLYREGNKAEGQSENPLAHTLVVRLNAPDKAEVDAYILGVFEPVNFFTGVCIAVIHRTDDDDDKLVVAPEGKQYTDEQIRALTEFQERFFTSEIVRG